MFKNIVIPVDLLDKQSVKPILQKALTMASLFEAKLHFLYIVSDFGIKMVEDYLPKNWIKSQKEKFKLQLEGLVRQYIPKEISVNCYVGRGPIYDEIIQYTNEVHADLIIISAVRPQLRDYMLGPNASKIVRHAGVSVLVIRE